MHTHSVTRSSGPGRRVPPAAALLLWALLGCASTPGPTAPPPAPGHLQHSLRLLLLAEEKFEHAEWAAAAAVTDAARAELARIEPQLRQAAGRRAVRETFGQLDSLREALAARDRARAMAAYAGAERGLFAIVDRFSHTVHPVFAVLDADVREGLAHVQLGEFDHAAVELEEVAAYLAAAQRTEAGTRLGRAEFEELRAMVGMAREAVAARNASAAEAAFAALASRTARLLHP